MIVKVCEADTPTKTNYIYPQKVLENQITALKEVINTRGFLGVLDVPESTTIEFSNVSHLVVDLFMDGNKLMADIEVIDTPSGRILKQLLDEDNVEFSMLGIGGGKLNEKNQFVVNDSYKLIQVFAKKPT